MLARLVRQDARVPFATLAAALCVTLAGTLCASPAALAHWSAAARPAGCAAALPAAVAPLIAFPSSEPQIRSGAGALLWDGPAGCGREAGTVGEVLGAPLGADDLPGPGRPLGASAGAGARDLADLAAAAGTALGQVVAVGSEPERGRAEPAAAGAIAEGRVVGAFTHARPLGGPAAPLAVASGYLGDVVVVSAVRARGAGWDLAVRLQRHYSSSLARARLLPAGAGRPSALAAGVDYHGDVLVAWARGGVVYAREIAQSGAAEPVRWLGRGAGGRDLELGALISDDGHAIVAWSSRRRTASGEAWTSIELSVSGPGARVRPAGVVERFRDPRGATPPPAGSLRLIRLSSEAVMLAWTGVSGGRYVVRASPVSLRRGAWAPVTISSRVSSRGGAHDGDAAAAAGTRRGGDALLADLVPGPDAEALAVWTVAPRMSSGAPDPRRRAIFAARGHYAGHGEVAFEPPEVLAPPGPNGPPGAAFDPRSGRALAAWVTRAGRPRIAYALRGAGPALRTAASTTTIAGAAPIAVAALALAAIAVAAGALRLLRRGMARRAGAPRPR